MSSHDPLLDHRARIERMQTETAERRERALIDQRSPENTPEVRVRIWEKLHQVRLPKSDTHAILAVVAKQTGMPLAAILEVQRLRAEPTAV
jgi:hypothetical protein